ncbi:MAG: VWA domain-containing protein, partial [Verrucomicrobiales bacterium]
MLKIQRFDTHFRVETGEKNLALGKKPFKLNAFRQASPKSLFRLVTPSQPMDNEGIQIIPFYFLADVSGSMSGAPLDALNNLLPMVKESMQANPVVADMIRFGLISFSTDAKVELPLSDLATFPTASLPKLVARSDTNFGEALRKLKAEIKNDFRQLKGDGYKVKRPVALFLSDGAPSDSKARWQAAFADLTSPDFPQFPNLVPIGIGKCDREIMRELRHRKDGPAPAPALFLDDGTNVGAMINELI